MEDSTFGFEIDFLPVGDKSDSGDAICMRWGYNLLDKRIRQQTVVLIDGGFVADGEAIVKHIKKWYDSDTIDFMINTHPHRDHIGGLKHVLENMTVKRLIIHQPWNHDGLKKWFGPNKRITQEKIEKSLEDGLNQASELCEIATEQGNQPVEWFAGSSAASNGVKIIALGPSKTYYDSLLPQFSKTPGPGTSADGRLKYKGFDVAYAQCPLTDEGSTSAENNSGLVLAFILPTSNAPVYLLTGDAGMPALEAAARYANQNEIDLNKLRFMQIPHHGSVQNVGPTVLNAFLGTDTNRADNTDKTAYVSICKDPDPEHPAKNVLNAFEDRGCAVYETRGASIHHSLLAVPPRDWSKINPVKHFEKVQKFEIN